jgi:hypothetical protein
MINDNLRSVNNYITNKINTTKLSTIYFNNQRQNNNMEEIRNQEEVKDVSVSNVINTIFEIHNTLKIRKILIQRDARSALIISGNKNIESIHNTIDIGNNISNMFNCIICQDLCEDVVDLDCCGQVYCNSCIRQWISKENSCPMCRSVVLENQIKSNKFIKKIIIEIQKKNDLCDV